MKHFKLWSTNFGENGASVQYHVEGTCIVKKTTKLAAACIARRTHKMWVTAGPVNFTLFEIINIQCNTLSLKSWTLKREGQMSLRTVEITNTSFYL